MSAPAASASAVWLDVDPATGLPDSEVDDGLAMIQAFSSPEITVRGVSVVFGNTSLEQALPIAREVATRFGPPDLGVHGGAASAADLGTESAAVRALAGALRECPLTILALGPLTNVASLVLRHPELHPRIASIVVVAGRRPGQRFHAGARTDQPLPDFNFEQDPAAMAALLASPIELVLAPWEVSSHVWITRRDLEALRARSATGAWIADACQSWVTLWERTFGVDGFNPFDTLAVAWVTHPQLIESMRVGTWIETRPGDAAAAPAAGPDLLVDPARRDLKQATYCYRPRPELKSVLLERLAGR